MKAEFFDFGSDKWTNVEDYPNTRVVDYPLWICEYDMLYIPELAAYYVIGGADRSPSSAIVKFHDKVWSIVGQLNHPRKVSLASSKITDLTSSDIELNGQTELSLLPVV